MSVIALAPDASLATLAGAEAPTWAGHQLEVVTDITLIAEDWRRLEAASRAALFQGYDYLCAWVTHAAAAEGEEPVFIVGRAGGTTSFILPLAMMRRRGARLLTWLGQSHSNYGMAVALPGVFDGEDIGALVAEAARLTRADVVHLDKQPETWAGATNPFATAPGSRLGANDTFIVTLGDDYAAFHGALFSSRSMSGLKRKLKKMEDLGPVLFQRPGPGDRRRDTLDWFFVEKERQLAETGRASPFEPAHIKALYQALAMDAGTFEVDELTVGGERVAMAMNAYLGQTGFLINSAHVGGDYGRFSPGTQLTHRMVAQAHAHGARIYDFGPGELPYKLEWAPAVVPLRSLTLIFGLRGAPLFAEIVLKSELKTAAKRNARIGSWVRRAQTALSRLKRQA